MDATKLVVSQEVLLFGAGRILGKVVSVVPSIDVQSDDGLMRFDNDGKETEDSRYRRCGFVLDGPDPGFLPWVIEETSPEEIAAWKAKGR